jgi:hypothetical protein
MKQYLQDKSTYRTHRQFGDVGSTLKCMQLAHKLQTPQPSLTKEHRKLSGIKRRKNSYSISWYIASLIENCRCNYSGKAW